MLELFGALVVSGIMVGAHWFRKRRQAAIAAESCPACGGFKLKAERFADVPYQSCQSCGHAFGLGAECLRFSKLDRLGRRLRILQLLNFACNALAPKEDWGAEGVPWGVDPIRDYREASDDELASESIETARLFGTIGDIDCPELRGLDNLADRHAVMICLKALVAELVQACGSEISGEDLGREFMAFPATVHESFLAAFLDKGRMVSRVMLGHFLRRDPDSVLLGMLLDDEAFEDAEWLALRLIEFDGPGAAKAAEWLLAQDPKGHEEVLYRAWEAAGADSHLRASLRDLGRVFQSRLHAQSLAVSLPEEPADGFSVSLPEDEMP